MEIGKLNEIYSKLIQKYSTKDIDKNNDNKISQSEIIELASKDEEIKLELSEEDISSLDLSDDSEGSYIKTKTKDDGKEVITTYNSNGKPVYTKTKDKDGVERETTYSYNDDGSYTKTTINKSTGKTVTKNYDSAGKQISAKSVDKKGIERNSTYSYNDDGSYIKTTVNAKTKAKSKTKYDSEGNQISKTSSSTYKESSNRKVKTNTEYKYNSDGSYEKITTKKTYQKYGTEWKEVENYKSIDITKYDKDGKEITGDKDAKVERLDVDVTEYKDKVKSKGTTVVIFGAGCGGCENLVTKCNNAAQKLDSLGINVVNVANLGDTDAGELARKFGAAGYDDSTDISTWLRDKGGFSLPLVIKFVDGEPVASLDFSHLNSGSTGALIDEIQNPYGTKDEDTQKLHSGVDKTYCIDKLKSVIDEYAKDDSKKCKDMWSDSSFSSMLKILLELGVSKSKITRIASVASSGQYTVSEIKSNLLKLLNNIEK